MILRHAGCRDPDNNRIFPGRLLIGATAVLLCVGPALAFDLRVVGEVVERVEFDDNLRVEQDPDGDVYGSTTELNLDITAQTPRSTFNIVGGANFVEFGGPGASSDLDSIEPNVRGDLLIRGPRSTLGLNGSFRRENSVFTEFDDVSFGGFDETIVTDGITDRLSYSVGGDVTIDINQTDTVTAAVTYSVVDFAEAVDGLSPTNNLFFEGSWLRDLTERTNIDITGSLRFFEADNATQSESEVIELSSRLTSKLTPRLEVYGEGGISIIETDSLVAGVRRSETTVGPTFDIGLTYLLWLTTTFSASVTQTVSPSDSGDLNQRTGVTASLMHRINTVSSVSLGGFWAIQEGTTSGVTSASTDRTSASFSADYSVRLARYWRFVLGYDLRISDERRGTALSNNVFVLLSREFVLLP